MHRQTTAKIVMENFSVRFLSRQSRTKMKMGKIFEPSYSKNIVISSYNLYLATIYRSIHTVKLVLLDDQ